jgi:outer membrane protein OmpA-like peptidoglycan-associated protein
MNSKTLVVALFAAWSALCTHWYVCVIKEACEQKEAAAPVITTPAIEPESAAAEPAATEPAKTATGQKAGKQPAAGGNKLDESSIDRVQLSDLEDRVVINFPYSATRREDNAAIDDYLSRLADFLKSSGGSVTITGHTDFVGESKNNIEMGLRRANGIRDILVKKGVNKSQIKCKSSGESKPVASNDTALGRYKNRRVEIRVNP